MHLLPSRPWPLVLFLLGCGAAEGVATNVSHKVDEFTDDVDAWVNQEPLAQRHAKCDAENGIWIRRVEVSACKEGRVTITLAHPNDDSVTQVQHCVSGRGSSLEWQCMHEDSGGLVYFNDGPSTPHLLQTVSGHLDEKLDQLRWNGVFWRAAVNHDYCYHHNGSTYGFEKNDCDQQFFVDLTAICLQEPLQREHDWFDEAICKRQAAAMYHAVQKGGNEAWEAMDTAVAYPEWRPLWQEFGMNEAPSLQTLGGMLEGALP